MTFLCLCSVSFVVVTFLNIVYKASPIITNEKESLGRNFLIYFDVGISVHKYSKRPAMKTHRVEWHTQLSKLECHSSVKLQLQPSKSLEERKKKRILSYSSLNSISSISCVYHIEVETGTEGGFLFLGNTVEYLCDRCFK